MLINKRPTWRKHSMRGNYLLPAQRKGGPDAAANRRATQTARNKRIKITLPRLNLPD